MTSRKPPPKGKRPNIKVVVRVRPQNEKENNINSVHAILPITSSQSRSHPSSRSGPLGSLSSNKRRKKEQLGTSSNKVASKGSASGSVQRLVDPTPGQSHEYETATSLVANEKTFDFDGVIAPGAMQKEVYKRIVGNAVQNKVFQGFNTTVSQVRAVHE